eukprot:576175-Karenia_brevis.AAC.1
MDLKPEKFDNETPGKSFKSWATDMITFIGLQDPGAEEIMKEVPPFKMKLPEDYTEDEEETSTYLYGVLLMLTAGEAIGI